MAVQEVAKHTKEVLKIAAREGHPLAHKLREIALEVAIIVFAVSLSIWMHSAFEHRHEQVQVRDFLLGLKDDIGSDRRYLEKCLARMQEAMASMNYLASLDPKGKPDPRAFDAAYARIDDYFLPVLSQRGRYEGFKSSGKLTNVEDGALLGDVLNLYESHAPANRVAEALWKENLVQLRQHLDKVVDADRDARYKLITSERTKTLLRAMNIGPVGDYRSTIELSKKIVDEIERAYPASAH